jgi:hypothetical protein
MTEPRPNMVDELTVRLALIRACKEAGTYKNFAYGHNISPTSVWEVVNGLHAPGGNAGGTCPMNFPSRPIKNLSVREQPPCRIVTHPRFDRWVAKTESNQDSESTYRESCITFLHAVLNGAPPERLRELAGLMWVKREAVARLQNE